MSSINTHGIKMVGLEEASEKTSDWPIGFVNIIRYDPETGDVWATEATSDQLAGKYDVFRTNRHVSAQRIADEIAELIRRSKI